MSDQASLFDDQPAGDSDGEQTGGRVDAALGGSWDDVAEGARHCQRCPLWEAATQTVFGEGPVPAEVMMVGEQPGDHEDLEGKPFVGPAGRVFDEALRGAGIDREVVYVTNAVKHFKWTPRGQRRLHQKPDRAEIQACRPWLDTELQLVRPRLLILLGATAAQGIFGAKFRVTVSRGVPQESDLAEFVVATIHPSAILRAEDRRDVEMAAFTRDLASAWALLRGA